MSETPPETPTPAPDPKPEQPKPEQPSSRTFTQDDVNRLLADEKRKVTNRYSDYDAVKEKASQFEALEAASRTDQEKAVDEAKKTTRAEVLASVGAQLVAAEFRAQAAGRLTPEQASAWLEDANTSKYLDKQGRVDTDALKARVESLAVEPPARFPDLGGGRRGEDATQPDMNSILRHALGRA